jgi:predicted helicase
MQEQIQNYLDSLRINDCLNQTEHTGRAFLQNLLQSACPQHLLITHEAKRNKDGFGAPDFSISHQKQGTIIGYLENKKIDENLTKIINSPQIEKYQKLSDNLIITDYLNWIWLYKNTRHELQICTSLELQNKNFKISAQKAQEFADFLAKFYSIAPQQIGTTKELAQKLARPTIEIKNFLILQIEEQTQNPDLQDKIYGIFDSFKTACFQDMKPTEFADSFAQMFSYAVFLARLNTNEIFTLSNIDNHIPKAFSLIKSLSSFLDSLNDEAYTSIKWAVENILSVANNICLQSVVADLQQHNLNQEKDPYIYFYEDFLKEYDAKNKVDRGVYYTPPAVVKFIVEAVSQILQDDFNLTGGLANQSVKLLDFACGTGGFLFEAYQKVLANTIKNSLTSQELIENHLLKNFYGFEIMVSSYIISHLKLSQFLKEHAYDITSKQNKRIGVYLTNTLENQQNIQENFFIKELANEAKKAKEIKEDTSIIAIIGNPPYNVSSQNSLKQNPSLEDFHNRYKPQDEKNFKNICDDYIKFIAFAHQKIALAKQGVVGVVVNNSFLKGLTHRTMRNSLMADFEKIYIIDLHGNARIKETSPTGGLDQNVFNIMQGVCILLLVKNSQIAQKGVFLLDLYGKRAEKLAILPQINLKQLPKLEIASFNLAFRGTKWGKSRFIDDLSFFSTTTKQDAMLEYGNFWGITDIFVECGSGVQTERDDITISFKKEDCQAVVDDFKNLAEQQIRNKYLYNKKTNKYHEDSRDWQVMKAKKDIQNNYNKNLYQKINYRPFDERYTFYTGTAKGFLGTPGFNIMQHMLSGENIGLMFSRQVILDDFNHIMVVNGIVDRGILFCGSGAGSLAPLYVYKSQKQLIEQEILLLKKDASLSTVDKKNKISKLQEKLATASEEPQKIANFSSQFLAMLQSQFAGQNIFPQQVLAFIYAQMHATNYRNQFLELLKIDFPRVNFAVDFKHFLALAELGYELISCHLNPQNTVSKVGEAICDSGFTNIKLKKPKYLPAEQKLYISENCYFNSVSPAVYGFKIGGYVVLDKYLKDRHQQTINLAEVKAISNIIKTITKTIEIIKQINEIC